MTEALENVKKMLLEDKARLLASIKPGEWISGYRICKILRKYRPTNGINLMIAVTCTDDSNLTPQTPHCMKFCVPTGELIVEATCEVTFYWEFPGENMALMRIQSRQVELGNF